MTGFVQVGSDSSVRFIDNDVVQLPAGTTVTNNDGTTTTLSAPAYYYRQRVINADPANPLAVATVTNQTGPNPNDFGLSVRMPAGQADLQTIAALLLDIDTNIAAMAGTQPLAGAFPSPQAQFSLPLVGGLAPGQFTPTIPRAVVSDPWGRQIVVPHAVREMAAGQATTITSSTSETTILTAGDNQTFNDVVGIIASNTSATATRVDIRDQLSTVTTIPSSQNGVIPLYLPAGDMRGISLGGVIIKQTNAGQAWTATCGTSVADVRIWVLYIKNRSQ